MYSLFIIGILWITWQTAQLKNINSSFGNRVQPLIQLWRITTKLPKHQLQIQPRHPQRPLFQILQKTFVNDQIFLKYPKNTSNILVIILFWSSSSIVLLASG